MEVVKREGTTKEKVQVEDQEEVLPDGTVHHIHKERSSSFKQVQKYITTEDGKTVVVEESMEEVPESVKLNLVETFQGPDTMVHEEKDYDVTKEDGRKVHQHVVLNRVQHHIHTHQESFDSDHGRQTEDFDEDEVVPGTESAFVVMEDDEEEDDVQEKKKE